MSDVEMFQSESEYTDEEQDYESDESHDESDGDKEVRLSFGIVAPGFGFIWHAFYCF